MPWTARTAATTGPGHRLLRQDLPRASLPDACRCYLELQGANATATVYLNGRCLGCHHGGYSTWRVELTPALAAENLLVIAVDNGDSDAVYPQMADFTFYGGLYRAVQLLCVDPVHFTLDDHGGPGLVITPEVQGDTARVHLEAAVTGGGKRVRDYVPAL